MSQTIEITKLDIAIEYLDAAMQMYVDQRNYFCAVHLAGAATELFDAHLPKQTRISEIAWKCQRALHESETGSQPSNKEINEVVNGSRNAIKHMDQDGVVTVAFDPIAEAEWYIDNALISFEKLRLTKTPAAWRYQDHRNAEMRRA
jgi:hypothetical protein